MTKPLQEVRPAQVEVHDDAAKAATGTDSRHLRQRLVDQLREALWPHSPLNEEEMVSRAKAMLAALAGIRPQDEVEGMLAVQMVATHNVAMDCLRRAAVPEQTFEGRELNLRHAGKLLALYLRQVEVLDRHRGQGKQTVTVNSVNVEPGGQAMVGHVHTGQLPSPELVQADASVAAVPSEAAIPLALDPPSAAGQPRRRGRRDG